MKDFPWFGFVVVVGACWAVAEIIFVLIKLWWIR